MQRYHLFTTFLELAGDRRPRVIRLDEVASRLSEGIALLRIAQQPYDGAGKLAGVVGRHEVAPWFEREPFGTHRGRDDRLGHRQRLENLEARAAAGPKRNDVDGGLGNRRPHVINRARH